MTKKLEKDNESNSSFNASNQSSTVTADPAKTYVRLKYEMCKNFREKGVCKYGDRCLFAHGDHELIKRGQIPNAAAPEKKDSEPAKTEQIAAPDKSPELETGKGELEKTSKAGSDNVSPQSSDEGDPGESTTQSSADRIQLQDQTQPMDKNEESPSAFKDLLDYLDITNIEIKQG